MNPAVDDRQGGLACYGSWGCKDSDMTEGLNRTEQIYRESRKNGTEEFIYRATMEKEI